MLIVAEQHCAYPSSLFFEWILHSLPKLLFQFFQLCLHALAHGLSQHRESSPSRLPADMRESKKVECLGFAFTPLFPIACRISSKLYQSSLSFMQLQIELRHSFS